MTTIDLAYVSELYREYAGDLARVGAAQRGFAKALGSRMNPQLDDLEA